MRYSASLSARSRRPAGALAALLGLSAALAGCSGSASTPKPVVSVEATQAADPAGHCDKQAFQTHAGLALGSVQTYLWKPYVGGAFAAGAKHRATAMHAGAGAGALASKEMATAKPLVAGCQASIMLVNALTTGSSLAHAASVQLAGGTVNAETVAGVNSIGATLVAQAANLGITLKPSAPTAAQVTQAG